MPVVRLTLIVLALRWARPARDESGASLVEYALLLLLIVVVAVVALTVIGDTTANSLNNSTNLIFNP
jgi:Flp pilus assembly pilin Flp